MGEKFGCTLCFDLLIYPVTLPCKHRFCKLCLDKHFDNNGFTCPLCRFRVSNWLRKLKLTNANLVDIKFWKLVKTTYPTEVEARLSESTDVQIFPVESGNTDGCCVRVLIINELKRDAIVNEHTQYKAPFHNVEEWRGWPDSISTVCRDVACQVSQQIATLKRTSSSEKPRLNISQPGEIRKEYEDFLRKEQEEKSKEEEKNLRLSKELIAMLEADEARENEKRLEQLRADEELARRLEEESRSKTTAEDVQKTPETPTRRTSKHSKVSIVEKSESNVPPTNLNHETTAAGQSTPSSTAKVKKKTWSEPCCSTPKTSESLADLSHFPLDTPSTSKDDIFSKNFKRTLACGKPKHSSHDNFVQTTLTPAKSVDKQPVPSTFSSPELSHFASVIPRSSTSINEPSEVKSCMSRSSSGSDSIGQELRHFKPIRTSPTTPNKEGNASWMPQVVVAQRGVATTSVGEELIQMICDDPESDISAQDIEDSIALEKQMQADHELAAMIQKEWDAAENKRKRNGLIPTAYNLRNKKKKGNLRKKVLVDRAQNTLDGMLIK